MAESMGDPESSWWGGWLQSAKEKSIAAVDFVKRDLAEFTSTMTNDTTKIVEVTSSTIKESLTAENTSVAKDKVKQSINTLFSGLSKALTVPHDDHTPKPKLASEGAAIFDRSKVRLRAIQVDPGTYLNKPSGPAGLFQDWLAGFKMDEKKGDISEVLVGNVEVRAMYTKLVPMELSHGEFWQRYFYKLHQLEMDEVRKQAMMTRAEREREDSLGWEDDWSGDEEFEDLSKTDLTPGSDKPTASDTKHSILESDTSRLSSSVLLPIPERGKETAPLNESQSYVQSEHSHIHNDSTACDTLPCDQKHTDLIQSQQKSNQKQTDVIQSQQESDQKHTDVIQSQQESDQKHTNVIQSQQESDQQHTDVIQSQQESDQSINSNKKEEHLVSNTDLKQEMSSDIKQHIMLNDAEMVHVKGSNSTAVHVKEFEQVSIETRAEDGSSNQSILLETASDAAEPHKTISSNTKLSEKSKEHVLIESGNNNFESPATDIKPLTTETEKITDVPKEMCEAEKTPLTNPETLHALAERTVETDLPERTVNTDLPERTVDTDIPERTVDTDIPERTVDTDLPASLDSPIEATSQEKVEACAVEEPALDIKTKIKGDMVLVGSDRESPNSDSSGTKEFLHLVPDPSTEEDWEHDFDLEVTEEDLKAADEIAKHLGTDLDLQDEDWESWE